MINQDIFEFMSLWRGSFINKLQELILDPNTNLYFNISKVETRTDLYKKIISACSRDACKREPYGYKHINAEYRKRVRDRINSFLGVNYTEDEWMLIYTYLGNGCNSELCDKFIESDFNLQVIRDHEARRRSKI